MNNTSMPLSENTKVKVSAILLLQNIDEYAQYGDKNQINGGCRTGVIS